MPDIATGVEQGYPDFVARLFVGLFAPAKTPKPILARIEQATRLAMQDPRCKKLRGRRLRDRCAISDSAAAAAYVNKEIVALEADLEQFGAKK